MDPHPNDTSFLSILPSCESIFARLNGSVAPETWRPSGEGGVSLMHALPAHPLKLCDLLE